MQPGLPPSPYPRLVGDIGGTNARFALVEAAGHAPSRIRVLACADYARLEDAVADYLSSLAQAPRCASLGIANPLQGDWVQMTNHHWAFSANAVRAHLGLERLALLNDFTALALGVPLLGPHERLQVGPGEPRPGAVAVLGPGTGLGMSGLLPTGEDCVVLASEGGHATLAASNAQEAAVIAWLWRHWPHVSAERVLSGPGLVLLHQALAALRGQPPETLSAADITRRAHSGEDALCGDTVSMFCAFLGTVASDLALTLGASGGVYLAGGVLAAMAGLFPASPFRARFDAKGRFSAHLARIPTYLVQAPYCAVAGAARALDLPGLPAGCIDART